MIVWWKDGITLPSRGNSGGKLGRPKSAAPLDWCGWPLAAPTVILGAVGSKLIVCACFEKYKPLAPESTMAVWSSCLCRLWDFRGGGIQLTLGELLNALKCVILFANFSKSAAPPCHKLLFQLGGRLLAFLDSPRHVSSLWKTSFLQLGQVLGICLSGGVFVLAALSKFWPSLIVRVVTSATILELVATKALLLIVISAIVAVSCASTNFSVVATAAMLSK